MLLPETTIELTQEVIGEEAEAELTEWLAAHETQVAHEQPIAELTTNKAIIELTAPVAGLLRQLVATGEMVTPGIAIGTITHP
jgi:pyruvate/2-oxoglutarate dehydrogenase complex dihydrolipoamide acyltransferase (E2) component